MREKANPLTQCDKTMCRSFIASRDENGRQMDIGRCSALIDTVEFQVRCPFFKTDDQWKLERKISEMKGHRTELNERRGK